MYHTNWFYPLPSAGVNNCLKKPHLSIRTIESILSDHKDKRSNAYSVCIIHPDFIQNYLDDGDIVLISTMDPLGIGPATNSWRFINAGTPYHVYYFWDLIQKIHKLKKHKQFKLMVGGAGAWQFLKLHDFQNYGIDHVFIGEAEKTLSIIIENELNEIDNPSIIYGEPANSNEIPSLLGPTNLNMVEISRGCGRMCPFCTPTRNGKMRFIPKDVILKTAFNFIKNNERILNLQSEDTLRYGSNNFSINEDELLGLYKDLFSLGIKKVFITHATFANFVESPDIITKLTNILNKNGHKYYGFQPGIESGSDRLMRKLMEGKYLPIKDMTWQEIVLDAFKVCNLNKWVPTASVILGLPGENKEDLKETKVLISNLISKDYLFIFAPLIFVSMPKTPLEPNKSANFGNLSQEQKELFKMMWKYNARKIMKVWNVYNIQGYHFMPWQDSLFTKAGSLISRLL
jgi:radical SAM superfamily enzyme YgiQ (UPF0313 family)